MPQSSYFERTFVGPWKGINESVPESLLDPQSSRFFINFVLKNGELRTRPRFSKEIPGPPDKNQVNLITSFTDANNVSHTCVETSTGLWQLNPNWRNNKRGAWNLVGPYPAQPGPGLPVTSVTYLNKLYWVNGGCNTWVWDGISSIGSPQTWTKATVYYLNARVKDTNGNVQIAVSAQGLSQTPGPPVWNATVGMSTVDGTVTWINNGAPAPSAAFISTAVVDATLGTTAGAYFIGELSTRVILLSTLEGKNNSFQSFPQRIRWCASGIPNIWDTNVNVGAGFNDQLDVPDFITGFLTIGRVGFVFRSNGITEMVDGPSGSNPFNFNHLWASDRGIGNVFPYTIAGYGPIGIFGSSDDFYNLSLGGFTKIGGTARDAIFRDLGQAIASPIATIIPYYTQNYVYPVYFLAIPIANGTKIWSYAIEDKSWQPFMLSDYYVTSRGRFCFNG